MDEVFKKVTVGELRKKIDSYLSDSRNSEDDLVMLMDDGMRVAFYTSFGLTGYTFERETETPGIFKPERIFGILFDKYHEEE